MDREYIKVENISKKIKGNLVLDDVNFSLKENLIMGLTGANGSGKTMLLRAIAGLIRTSGRITIGGAVTGSDAFARDTGVLIENPAFLNDFSGFENLKLLAMLQDGVTDNDIREALVSTGLDPEDGRTFKKYSLGMKERLGIAQAILKKPRLILLDEPTNGVDRDGIQMLVKLMKDLKQDGCTIIIASHDREFLKAVADVSYEMERGKLICQM